MDSRSWVVSFIRADIAATLSHRERAHPANMLDHEHAEYMGGGQVHVVNDAPRWSSGDASALQVTARADLAPTVFATVCIVTWGMLCFSIILPGHALIAASMSRRYWASVLTRRIRTAQQ